MKQKKHNCERCIHFYDSMPWQNITGICSKRNKVKNKGGFPCKYYELPLKWWQRIIRKLVKK